jgi:hypothetical protein
MKAAADLDRRSFRRYEGAQQCVAETAQDWAKNLRCIRAAKYLVDGKPMCRLHAAYAALDSVVAEELRHGRT